MLQSRSRSADERGVPSSRDTRAPRSAGGVRRTYHLAVIARPTGRRLLVAAALLAAAVAAPAPVDASASFDLPLGGGLDDSQLLSVPEAEVVADAETVPGQYLVTFASDDARLSSLPIIQDAGWTVLHDSGDDGIGDEAGTVADAQPWALVELPEVSDGGSASLLAELRSMGDTVRVSPNHVRRLVQTDPPWGLDRIDQRSLPLSGSYLPGGTGQGVRVYVIDDGIRREHTDFGGRVTAGVFLESLGSDSDPFCSTHGSHVAGTVGGAVSGVAKQVELIPVRVFNCQGAASDSAVIQSMEWIRTHHLGRGGGTAVVNMSFGGPASSVLDAKVAELDAAGLLVVAAAGNEGVNACSSSPARAATSLTVAASTASDARASFSNVGSCVDLFAPGQAIRSVDSRDGRTSGFVSWSGTSMAAPHAAGAAALLIQRNPGWSPAQVRQRLIADATTGVISNPGTGTPNRLLWVAPPAAPTPSPSPELMTGFVAAQPARLVDSRSGLGVGGALRAGQTVTVRVAGRAGVPADARAVALNVTAVDAGDVGFVSVMPCTGRSAVPSTSNLNFAAGQTVANSVVTALSSRGEVCVYASAPLHLLVDVVGSFDGGFSEVAPTRLLDTRRAGVAGAGSITRVRVAGRAGVPSSASAAVLNVTAVDPLAPGYLTVYPCGGSPPNASNVNYTPGQVVPNAVVSRMSSNGEVCIFTSATTHLLVDVAGSLDGSFVSLTPARLLETRSGPPPGPGSVTRVEVAGRAGVPRSARAVVVNVTAVDPSAPGYVSVFPCGADWRSFRPTTSSLNYAAGQTVANAVVAPLGTAGGSSAGAVCLYTSAPSHLLVDVAGAFR